MNLRDAARAKLTRIGSEPERGSGASALLLTDDFRDVRIECPCFGILSRFEVFQVNGSRFRMFGCFRFHGLVPLMMCCRVSFRARSLVMRFNA